MNAPVINPGHSETTGSHFAVTGVALPHVDFGEHHPVPFPPAHPPGWQLLASRSTLLLSTQKTPAWWPKFKGYLRAGRGRDTSALLALEAT